MSEAVSRTNVDEGHRDLRALEEIEGNPSISQRELARSMGVALGVANACVRTLVRKGLIKVRGESNRSITYHLTKEGQAQKARLAMEWTSNTIHYYRQARTHIVQQVNALVQGGVRRVALVGADETAELVALLAPQSGLEIVAILDLEGERISDSLAGIPVSEPSEQDDLSLPLLLVRAPSNEQMARITSMLSGREIRLLNGETVGTAASEETS